MIQIKYDRPQVTDNIPTQLDSNIINWVVTCKEGFKFFDQPRDSPRIEFYEGGKLIKIQFVYNSDRTEIHINHTLEKFELIEEIKVLIKTRAKEGYSEIIKEFENCTSDIPDAFDTNKAINLVITADQGYKFEKVPVASYLVSGSAAEKTKDFILDSTNTIATLDTVFNDIYSKLKITAKAEFKSIEVEKYGSISPYIVTLADLKQFSEKRFFDAELPNIAIDSEGTGWNTIKTLQPVDLGEYVHSLKRAFFKVPNLGMRSNIYCGNYNTKITADIVDEPIITFDFGEILIPTFANSGADFENTQIELFIPFVGYKIISNDYINTQLKIVYKIDVISSIGVVFLYSNDMLIDTINCTPFKDIIYRKLDEQKGVIGSLPNDYAALYGLKPYLKVKWYKTINDNIYNSESKRAELKDLKGWNKIIDVEYNLIDDTITKTEVEILNSLLNRGVQIL